MACIFVQHVVDHTNTKCTQTKIATSAQSCIGIHPNIIQTCINKSIHRLLAMCTTNYDNAARIYFILSTYMSISYRMHRIAVSTTANMWIPWILYWSHESHKLNLNDTLRCSQRACNQLHKLTKAANRQLASFYVCFETRAKANRTCPMQKNSCS